jgi:hypothetical protein
MSKPTTTISSLPLEDLLTYGIPIAVALASFSWSSLIPGDDNAFFTAIAFGFLAKFLVGLQQNGWSDWEDLVPTITLSLGFLATTLSANPQFLEYGTIIGFIVKALGMFASGYNLEDLLLAIGAFLALYGAYVGNQEIVSAGALFALVGKSIPSLATGGAAGNPKTHTVQSPIPPQAASATATVQLSHSD